MPYWDTDPQGCPLSACLPYWDTDPQGCPLDACLPYWDTDPQGCHRPTGLSSKCLFALLGHRPTGLSYKCLFALLGHFALQEWDTDPHGCPISACLSYWDTVHYKNGTQTHMVVLQVLVCITRTGHRPTRLSYKCLFALQERDTDPHGCPTSACLHYKNGTQTHKVVL